MHDPTLCGGSPRTHGACGGSRRCTAGDRGQARGPPGLRGQAAAALAAGGHARACTCGRRAAARACRPCRTRPCAAGRDARSHHRRVAAHARGRKQREQPVGARPPPRGLRPDAKGKTARAAGQDRPEVAAARRAWRAQQPARRPGRLVLIDATWATTAMTRRHGRAPRGRRVAAAVPHGHCKTTTFLAALRHDGLSAPGVLDGALDGARCLADVEQALVPRLRAGARVVMDNLAAHKVAGVSAAIAAAGARGLHLPPDSPDRNPIEQVFAKLSRSSPSSKACAAAPQPAPSRRFGASSVNRSTPSAPKNAPTTSPTPAMFRPIREML